VEPVSSQRGFPIPAPFAYDAFEYINRPVRHCHPDRLFVVGRLFGISTAPVATCRILDIGCGSATHLLAAAVGLPRAKFVGLDLSIGAIGKGRALAAEAGITNVELLQADLMTYVPEPGSFDYVTAHGFYSWVPPSVRDRFLEVARAALAPHGIGYASYNTYPGCYLRRMFWDMMKAHAAGAADPPETVARARELAEFLASGQTDPDKLTARVIRAETERILGVEHPGSLYHDDLGDVNDPVYVTGFADHLNRHGLRYAAEAEVHRMSESGYPPPVAGKLVELRDRGLVMKEQYLDYLTLRRFRHTLFVRAERPTALTPQASAVPDFVIGLATRLTADHSDLSPGVPMTFQAADGGTLSVGHPAAKRAFLTLAQLWPRRIPFAELADQIGVAPAHQESLASLLLQAHIGGPIEFFGHVPPVATTIGTHPVATPLARAQVKIGHEVSTLYHKTLDVPDAVMRSIISLLDGTRERVALRTDCQKQFPGSELDEEQIDAMLVQLTEAGILMNSS
jgi:SAM-dependent methyltransferase